MNTTAYLSNDGEYTYFYIGDRVVTFLTRKSLEQYKKIVEWDNGYLVVMCKNKNGGVYETRSIISGLLAEDDNLWVQEFSLRNHWL